MRKKVLNQTASMLFGLICILLGVIYQVSLGDPVPVCSICTRLFRKPGIACERSLDCGECLEGFMEPVTHGYDNGGKQRCLKGNDGGVGNGPGDVIPKDVSSPSAWIIGIVVVVLVAALAGLTLYTYKRKRPLRSNGAANRDYIEIHELRSGVIGGNVPMKDPQEDQNLIQEQVNRNGRRPVEDEEYVLGAPEQNGHVVKVEALQPITRCVSVTNERRQESIPINRDEGNPNETFPPNIHNTDDSITPENSLNITRTLPIFLSPTAPPNTNSTTSGITAQNLPSANSSVRSSVVAENGGERYSLASTAMADDQPSSFSARSSKASDCGYEDKMESPTNKESIKIGETVENGKIKLNLGLTLDLTAHA